MSVIRADPVFEWRRSHLQTLIDLLGDGKRTEFARRYGWDRSQIAQFLSRTYNNGRSIGEKAAREIEERVRPDYPRVMRWMDSPPEHPGLKLIAVSAGYPRIAWRDVPQWRIDPTSVPRLEGGFVFRDPSMTDSDNKYALEIDFDSMIAPPGIYPTFPMKMIVLVDAARTPANGNYVVVLEPETRAPTLRKLVQDAGRMYLHPLNPLYRSFEITDPDDLYGVAISSHLQTELV